MSKKAQKAINSFLSQDSEFSLLKKENFKSFKTIEPNDLKKSLKRVYLAAKPIQDDISRFAISAGKNKKMLTKHKKQIQENLVKSTSSELITEISKVHHSLTYFICLYINNITVINTDNDLFNRLDRLIDYLKDHEIKSVLDSDELTTLYTFNSLRNSLIHSANYETFYYLDQDYLDAISELLDNVQPLFEFFKRGR